MSHPVRHTIIRLVSCVMPKEGIFIKVIAGGRIRVGDSVEVSYDHCCHSDAQ